LAHAIATSEVLRATARGVLRPLVYGASLANASPSLALLFIGGGVLACLVTPFVVSRARRRLRNGGRRSVP